ncbi:MAG: PorV/PorQ family protein [Bacteroidota bacterium]
MKRLKAIVIVLICIGLQSSLFAGDKVAQSKMQFLKIGVGARAAGMGDAFTAVGKDPNSIFFNPAAPALSNGLNLTLNSTQWIADINHLSGVISYTWEDVGTFTLDYINVDYGPMQRTIVDPHGWESYQTLGEFTVKEYAIGLGFAKELSEQFSVGGQVKYIYQNLGDTETWWYIGTEFEEHKDVSNIDDAIAFDLGTYYDTQYKGLKIGMAIQNFANKAIPLTFRFGLSFELNQVLFPENNDHIIMLAWDALHPKDYGERQHFGLEYSFRGTYYLRTGYKFNYDNEDISAGLGVNVDVNALRVSFEYAYSNFSLFGNVNRFTVSLKF